MSWIIAALVTFFCILLVLKRLSPTGMRRVIGYAGWVDLLVHGTILYMFIGTSTMGLLQAEASGILFSLYLRWYRWSWGFERWERWDGKLCWVRYSGKLSHFFPQHVRVAHSGERSAPEHNN